MRELRDPRDIFSKIWYYDKVLMIEDLPALKNSMVFDLSFMNFARFELYLALQINISCRKNAIIEVGVKCSD